MIDASFTEQAAKAATQNSLIPSHDIAVAILRFIDRMLDLMSLRHDKSLEEIIYTIIILAISLFIGLVIRWLIITVVDRVVKRRHSPAMKQLLKMHTINKATHFITPMVFLGMIPFAFVSNHHALDLILRLAGVYCLITIAIAINAILEYSWWRFDQRDNRNNHPLKGVLNICRGLVWIVIMIISVSVIIDKSPLTLLAGLGAFAAALMLIFKDSILGFVAGIQLSSNDMLRVGDWIVVPSTIANGVVIDVTLSVVKVQNWDNTIVMLPPYTLVSTSFQNWRGMTDVGARLVNRDIYIAQPSIRPMTGAMLTEIVGKYPVLAPFVKQCRDAQAAGRGKVYNEWTRPNGSIDTNLGLFRAYITSYLLNHPQVSTSKPTDFIIVALSPAKDYGQPLNIEFFSKITDWAPFEALLSDIFEDFAIAAPDFGLTLTQAPDGNTFTIRDARTPAPVASSPEIPSASSSEISQASSPEIAK